MTLVCEELTKRIIGAAIEVHRNLGPGLLESAYLNCLCHELEIAEIPYQREVLLPVKYKGVLLECGYRMDLVVDQSVVLELKCVDQISSVHEAQLFTYLRLSNLKIGFLINFNTEKLVNGIVRRVL